MKQFLAALLICTLPSFALTQIAPVIAGEHSDFTRIVVTIPEDSEWTTKLDSSIFSLKVDKISSFDTKSLFLKIPKTRILEVKKSVREEELNLHLNCECDVDYFLYDRIYLVIDFSNRAQPLEVPQIIQSITTETTPPWTAWWAGRTRPKIPSQLDITHKPIPNENEVPRQDQATYLTKELTSGIFKSLNAEPLRINQSTDHSKTDLISTSEVDSIKPSSAQIGIKTEIPYQNRHHAEESPSMCAYHTGGELEGDHSVEAIQIQISYLKKNIYTERGLPVDENIVKLAKLFIAIGFISESRLILSEIKNPTDKSKLLLEISAVIDSLPSPEVPILNSNLCRKHHIYWIFLSGKNNFIDYTLIINRFKSLSRPLQKLLYLRTYDQLLKNLHFSAAAEIERYMDYTKKNSVQHSADSAHSPLLTHAKKKGVNWRNPQLIIEALTKLEGKEEFKSILEISKPIRFEHRGTPQWGEIINAEINASITQKVFIVSLALLSELDTTDVVNNLEKTKIWERSVNKIVTESTDTEFIYFYLNTKNKEFSEDINSKILLRLNKLGISERLPNSTPAFKGENPVKMYENLYNTAEGMANRDKIPKYTSEASEAISARVIRNLMLETEKLKGRYANMATQQY